jgi:glycosyltransferase involved in cell wall biosynthesis
LSRAPTPDCDISVVIRVRDDEERIGHVVRRVARHLAELGQSHEILVADEGSGDNTVAVAALLRRTLPQVEVLHTEAGDAFHAACERARGRTVLLYDARSDAPLAALGFALQRLGDGHDVVAVPNERARYCVFRRVRALRAFDALAERREPRLVGKRFLRRARGLGLSCTVTQEQRRTPWAMLRAAFASR